MPNSVTEKRVLTAAKFARTSAQDVREALDSGDLRNLTPRCVELWARAIRAAAVVHHGHA